jgi:hypothetical protein
MLPMWIFRAHISPPLDPAHIGTSRFNVATCGPIARERVDKHFSIEMDSWRPTGYGRRFHGYEWSTNISLDTDTLYKRPFRWESSQTRVEAGSDTSTVTLLVVGGDEKGSLKSETVKYGLKSQGTRTRERLRWQGPAAHTTDRPDLSSERALYKNKTVTVSISNKHLIIRLTDWPSVAMWLWLENQVSHTRRPEWSKF